jgi:DNA polymerase-3 subunit gamma/tau
MRLSVSTVASGPNSRRVYILDEAHMLSKAAGNALLKTLEEPPPHVIFVLATTEPYKLADTIRSRTQRFDFHPVGIEALAAHLGRIADLEGYSTNAKALVALARHAGGSARDALSLLEQVAALASDVVDLAGVQRALGMADTEAYAALVEAVAKADARMGLELVAEMSARGIDLRRFVGEAIGFFRGIFLAHYAPNLTEVTDEPPEVLEAWKKAAKIVGPAAVLRAVDLLGEALVRLREGREERLMVELAVIRLTRPETSSDPDALTVRLERLERGSSPVAPPPGGSAGEATRGAREPDNNVADRSGSPLPPSGDSPQHSLHSLRGETGRLTMEAVQKMWPSLFGSLRQVLGPRRWALFREAAPGDIEEGRRLILDVSQDFHLEGLRTDPVVSALVATQAADLLGFAIEVGFRKTGALAEADDVPVDEGSLDKDRLFEAPPEDPTALLEKELGATLVVEDDERV